MAHEMGNSEKAQNSQGAHPEDGGVEIQSRKRSLGSWSVIGLAAVAIFLFSIWIIQSRYQRLITEDNQRISQAIDVANDWIAGNSKGNPEPIEQDLSIATASAYAENKPKAEAALKALREHVAQRRVDEIFNDAVNRIDNGRLPDAISLLGKYLSDPLATKKNEATTILAQAQLASSDTAALETLRAMTDEQLSGLKAGGTVDDGRVTYSQLVKIRIETIQRNVDKVLQNREEAKIAKQKREEEERIASLERQKREEERQRQAREKVEAEKQRIAALASASLMDISDDPDKFVGITFTMLVWINGSTLRRVKQTNNEDQIVVDGYTLEFCPADRDPKKTNWIGNRFSVLPDQMTPFISSKDIARGLQDGPDPNSKSRFQVTFTVKSVVLNHWKSLGKKSVGYLAEISNCKVADGSTELEQAALEKAVRELSYKNTQLGTSAADFKVRYPKARKVKTEANKSGVICYDEGSNKGPRCLYFFSVDKLYAIRVEYGLDDIDEEFHVWHPALMKALDERIGTPHEYKLIEGPMLITYKWQFSKLDRYIELNQKSESASLDIIDTKALTQIKDKKSK